MMIIGTIRETRLLTAAALQYVSRLVGNGSNCRASSTQAFKLQPVAAWSSARCRRSFATFTLDNDTYEKKLTAVLTAHKFLPVEVELIKEHLTKQQIPVSQDTLKTIEDAAAFWNASVGPPKKYSSVPVEDNTDYNMANVNYVMSHIEPDLLLVNTARMRYRIQNLRSVGFISGAADIWRVFVGAPRAYFLQDWSEFLRKYYYVEHRMMEWLLVKKGERYPVPHPLVRHPKVLQAPYEHIKARHLFAVKTGMKEISVTNKLDKSLSEHISLGRIVLTDLTDYLKYVAPTCTEEEYLVFEQYVADSEDDDDKTISELCDLSAQEAENVVKKQKTQSMMKTKALPLTDISFNE